MVLKYSFNKNLKEEEKELFQAVNDGKSHDVRLTTTELTVVNSDRDGMIKEIRKIKAIFKIKGGGCLEVKGSIGRDFREPFGGSFFVMGVKENREADFDKIEAVRDTLRFASYDITENDEMVTCLKKLAGDPKFVFRLDQFDEFMEVFEFYQALSSELNNNTTYSVKEVSQPYAFIPVYAKGSETLDENAAVYDDNGILIGYRMGEYELELLPEALRDEGKRIVDVTVKGGKDDAKKIRQFADNLYLNGLEAITEQHTRGLRAFDLVNLYVEGERVVLSGETAESDLRYLHLYDMGQKIKLESIANSLRLIHQGASGAAAQLLEYIIGDKPMPSNSLSLDNTKRRYAKHLDPSQKKAFFKAVDGSPVTLIKGPPGTGKTHVINAIVQYITKELKEKVVISSQTHVAIDNVLDKLMENHDLIIPKRITNRKNKYAGDEIDRTLYKTWGAKLPSHLGKSEERDLSEALLEDMKGFDGEKRFSYSSNPKSVFSVIGATTTTSAIGGKKGIELLEGYDWLIIDEVSKCPITEVLRYLPYIKHIIMVGDDFQLAPLLEFDKEKVAHLSKYDEEKFDRLKQIYEESVFAKTLEKARKAERLVELSVNYRSVANLLRAYNVFYNGALENKREEVKPAKVQFDDVIPVLNEKDIFFVDVQNGKEAYDGTSRYNVEELQATVALLRDLLRHTREPRNVSVAAIFPYAAQIGRFKRENKELINEAKKTFSSFELDTVDAFQGKEADIVLVNTVVTTPRGTFLKDFRRINVSMSRARDKLFIFGNPTTLSEIDMSASVKSNKRKYFREILDDIRRYGAIFKYDGGISYATASKSKIIID